MSIKISVCLKIRVTFIMTMAKALQDLVDVKLDLSFRKYLFLFVVSSNHAFEVIGHVFEDDVLNQFACLGLRIKEIFRNRFKL